MILLLDLLRTSSSQSFGDSTILISIIMNTWQLLGMQDGLRDVTLVERGGRVMLERDEAGHRLVFIIDTAAK